MARALDRMQAATLRTIFMQSKLLILLLQGTYALTVMRVVSS